MDEINLNYITDLIENQHQEHYTYHVKYSKKKKEIEKYMKCLMINEEILLCKNAQVILSVNLDVENGLVNGSRGIIKEFQNGLPLVQFKNGIKMLISYYTYTFENDEITFTYEQIPLIHGWAITIHKSQGMTLDSVETDLSNLFDYGQGYVTLSRVRSLKDLYLLNLNKNKIKCHPTVFKFYHNM